MTKHPCVYILQQIQRDALCRRYERYRAASSEHKIDAIEGFIKEYDVHDLVFMKFPRPKIIPTGG